MLFSLAATCQVVLTPLIAGKHRFFILILIINIKTLRFPSHACMCIIYLTVILSLLPRLQNDHKNEAEAENLWKCRVVLVFRYEIN